LPQTLEIVVATADGNNVVDVSNSPDFVQRPAWSPDGSLIAFGTDRDLQTTGFTQFEIYTVKTDGSDARNLTKNPPADDNFPAWSADGSKIAFHSNRTGNYEVFIMNKDGTGVVNLTNNGTGDFLPAWSRDGTRIAFESTRDGNSELYVMNADGSGVKRLTNHPAVDSFASWRP
jgi:Tol biopolymer transport system component